MYELPKIRMVSKYLYRLPSFCQKLSKLKTRLVNEWAQLDQSIIDAAISQWRRRLSAYFRALRAQVLTILNIGVIGTYNFAK